jgi:hypothetical protein
VTDEDKIKELEKDVWVVTLNYTFKSKGKCAEIVHTVPPPERRPVVFERRGDVVSNTNMVQFKECKQRRETHLVHSATIWRNGNPVVEIQLHVDRWVSYGITPLFNPGSLEIVLPTGTPDDWWNYIPSEAAGT